MEKMNWIVGVAVASMGLAAPAAMGTWYTHSYEGDALPQDVSTNPQWARVLKTDGATESASSGILSVITAENEDYIEYRIDGGPASSWNSTGAGTTVEVRMKTIQNAGTDWAGSLMMYNGIYAANILFGERYITLSGVGDFRIDTNIDFGVYRFVMNESGPSAGTLDLYVNNALTPAKTWALGAGASNYFGFGDNSGSMLMGEIQWDYIRWTNEGAIVPVPEPAALSLAGAGLLMLGRRRRML